MSDSKQELIEIELLQSGYRYGWSLTSNRQDAEDLVHDAWIRLIRRYREVPGKSLLFTTIRHLYIDQLRREKQVLKHQQESHMTMAIDSSAPEADYIHQDEVRVLLSRLRDVENEAIFLSLVEGYTAEEIASLTSSTRGSVLSLLHRSKQKLRRWLTDDEHPPGKVVRLVTGGAKK
ncbi:MAG: RNA polymerase sigma factor [Granulosicoccus sp.]|nr:RNA polymerase sigma factor [Granulosicoccus sp.]